MSITAIQRRRVCDIVYDQLRSTIDGGTWNPGDRIPSEKELVALFQVSRATIREAIKKLESRGYLETRHGSGSYVKERDPGSEALLNILSRDSATIQDMMEFRTIVEVESTALATQRATEAELTELAGIYRLMVEARGNIAAFSAYDLQFHQYIGQMTKNEVLIRCYTLVLDSLKLYFDRVVETIGVDKGTYYHAEILRAMQLRDKTLARRIMREHLAATFEGVMNRL